MTENLKDIYKKCFDSNTKNTGEELYNKKQVLSCFKTETGYFSTIENYGINKVRIYTEQEKNSFKCSCYLGKNCPHIYGAILAIDEGEFVELSLNDSISQKDDLKYIKEIFEYLDSNKKKNAIELIDKVNNINYFYNGQTILNKACECDALSVIKVLIEHGADINAQYGQESNLNYALSNARKTEKYEVLDYLLRKGAPLNDCNKNGPLFKSPGYLDIAILKYLIRKGYDLKGELELNELFEECCRNGELELVKHLLEKGINVNKIVHAGKYKYTFLKFAIGARKNQYHITSLLLENGFDIKTCLEIRENILAASYESEDEKIVELLKPILASNGIDYKKILMDKPNMKMQVMAVEYINNNEDYVLELLDNLTPDDIKISKDAWVTTPSTIAYRKLLEAISKRRDKNTLKSLIQKVSDYSLETLCTTVRVHDFELFKEVAKNCENLKKVGEHIAISNLIYAIAEEDDDKALEYLYEKGITLENKEHFLKPIIQEIIKTSSKDILNHLLKYYDGDVLKKLIKTFIQENKPDLVAYLLESDKKDFYIQITDINNYIIEELIYKPACFKLFMPFIKHFSNEQKDELLLKIVYAMKRYYEPKTIEVVEELVNMGSSIDSYRKDGTVLSLASSGPNFNVVKYLIDKGADIKKSIELGFNPLQAALTSHYTDTIEYFLESGMSLEDYMEDRSFKNAYKNHLTYLNVEELYNPKIKSNKEESNKVYKFKIYIEGFSDTVYRIIQLDGSLPAGFLLQTIYKTVGIEPQMSAIINGYYYYEPHDYKKWYEEVLYKKFYIKDLDFKVNQKFDIDQMPIYEDADAYDDDSECLKMTLEVIEISDSYDNQNLIFLEGKSENMNEFISNYDDCGETYLIFDSPDEVTSVIDSSNIDDTNATLHFAKTVLKNYENGKIQIEFSEKDPNKTTVNKENIYNYLLKLDDKTLEEDGYLNKAELTKVDPTTLSFIITYGRIIDVDSIDEDEEDYYEY